MASAFQRRSITFRNRPSSALQTTPYGGSSLPPDFGGSTSQFPNYQNVGPGQVGGVGTPQFNVPAQVGGAFDGGGIYSPMPAYASPNYQGRSTERLQNYEDFARAYIGQLGNRDQFMPDPRDEAALNAEFAIRAKEAQLQQALIDGDLAEAQRLQGEIAANKDILSNAVPFTNAAAISEMDKAMLFARNINERNAPKASVETAGAMGNEIGAYAKGMGTTEETAAKIGAGDAALQAALSIAGADQDLYLQRELNRGKHTQNIIGFNEDVGVSGVDSIRKTFERQSMDDVAMDKQHWADEDRRIADIFKGLETKQSQLDLAKQRDALQKESARRGLYGDVEFQPQNPFDVGVGAATDYITQSMGDAPIHRVAYMHMVLEDLMSDPEYADFQAMGEFTPSAVVGFLSKTRFDKDGNPFTLQSELGLTTTELGVLSDAFGVYSTTSSQYNFVPTNRTTGGKGEEEFYAGGFQSWTGNGSQAPNNKSFADEARAGEGSYGARAEFVSQIGPQIAQAYGLQSWGQWRDLNAEVSGNRSANSDHYSGGAIDLAGPMSQMQAAAKDLVNRPYIAGVVIHEPGPHLHASFDINYFS